MSESVFQFLRSAYTRVKELNQYLVIQNIRECGGLIPEYMRHNSRKHEILSFQLLHENETPKTMLDFLEKKILLRTFFELLMSG